MLTDLFLERGVPVHIRSDNGSEFTAKKLREYLSRLEIKPLFIEPGSPWENGYIESFNGKMRDELLTGAIFYSITEAQVIIEQWRWPLQPDQTPQRTGLQSPYTSNFHPTLFTISARWCNIATGTTIGGRSAGQYRLFAIHRPGNGGGLEGQQ